MAPVTRALCCTARDLSPDPSFAREPVFLTRRHAQLNRMTSLTLSDQFELAETIPAIRASFDAQDPSDIATTTSSKSRDDSMVGLLKKKLSRASTFFKPSPQKKNPHKLKISKPSRAPLQVVTNFSKSHSRSDPRNSSYDPDARVLASADLMNQIMDAAGTSPQLDERSAEISLAKENSQAGKCAPNITEGWIFTRTESPIYADLGSPFDDYESSHECEEANKLLAMRTSQDTTSSSHDSATDACVRIELPESFRFPVEKKPTARDSFRHGKLPFELSNANLVASDTVKTSDIAQAVDSIFEPSLNPTDQIKDIPEETTRLPGASAHVSTANASDSSQQQVIMPRRNASAASIHLQNMRISQHLRCLSIMSDDGSGSGSFIIEPTITSQMIDSTREQTIPAVQQILNSHRRSSSGFDSNKMPEHWGRVIEPSDGSPTRQSAPSAKVRLRSDSVIDAHGDDGGKSRNIRSSMESDNPLSAVPTDYGRLKVPIVKRRPVGYDGPGDMLLRPNRSATYVPPSPSSGQSIASNYDETASMWEKAIMQHQEQRDRKNSNTSSGSRKSSMMKRKTSQRSTSIELDVADTVGRGSIDSQPSRTSFTLMRLNTAHTFDMLAVPRKPSLSQPCSPEIADLENSRRGSQFLAPQLSRVRSISEPPTLSVPDTSVPQIRCQSSELDVKSCNTASLDDVSGVSIPEIVLTAPAQPAPATPKKYADTPLSKRPWSRFPRHGREARNGPAGVDDRVVVKDFQAAVPDSPRTPSTTSESHRRRKVAFRASAFKIKHALLTDLPSVFKSSNNTFRRREHGHRSSISAGGTLEYPELELLPLAEVAPSLTEGDPYSAGRVFRRMSSIQVQHPPRHVESPTATKAPSRFTSSSYGAEGASSTTARTANRLEVPSQNFVSVRQTAEDWARVYGEQVGYSYRKPSTQISPLDGEAGQSFSESPATRSLPPTVRKRSQKQRRQHAISKATSEQELRRSTQDLNKQLDDLWRKSIVGLKAARDTDQIVQYSTL